MEFKFFFVPNLFSICISNNSECQISQVEWAEKNDTQKVEHLKWTFGRQYRKVNAFPIVHDHEPKCGKQGWPERVKICITFYKKSVIPLFYQETLKKYLLTFFFTIIWIWTYICHAWCF